MKKHLLFALAALPGLLFAQDPMNAFFSKYSGKEGFTTVQVSPKMFELVAALETDAEELSLIKDLTGITVLVMEDDGDHKYDAQQLTREAFAALGTGYEELLSVKESTTDLKILAKSVSNGIINDLVIAGYDDGEFIYVNVTGKMDIKKLNDLDTDFDIEGLEHLDRLGENDKK